MLRLCSLKEWMLEPEKEVSKSAPPPTSEIDVLFSVFSLDELKLESGMNSGD
jgi:hypothetical protein